jgi:glycosyltransferase involved in cell wall biosynthesis
LLDAARLLLADGLEFELRIHGGAPFQSQAFVDEIDRRFAETAASVQPRGPYRREDIGDLVAAVDCTIVPSVWWENAPLVIQEAQTQGRPVIASNIGGMAEMVEHGVNGLTVPPNDARALAAAMRSILEKPDLLREFSKNARKPDDIDTTARRYLRQIEPAQVRA